MTTSTLAQEALWRMSRDITTLMGNMDKRTKEYATVAGLMTDLNIASGYVWEQVGKDGGKPRHTTTTVAG